MPEYRVGQQVETKYTNAPVSDDRMYQIGAVVDITEDGEFLASFIVEETDNSTVKGIINRVRDVEVQERIAVLREGLPLTLPTAGSPGGTGAAGEVDCSPARTAGCQ